MDGKALARLVAIIIVAVAGTTAAIFVARDDAPPASSATSSLGPDVRITDQLHITLLRCAELGEAAVHDTDCLAAWAENRRRFLTPGQVH